MKDIGFYAGFLSPETQEAIRNGEMWVLCLTIAALAEHFADDFYYADDSNQNEWRVAISAEEREMSDRDKLCVIRGLCDRIERHLIEAEKKCL